jgi:phosphonate transport system substrate-binding protein
MLKSKANRAKAGNWAAGKKLATGFLLPLLIATHLAAQCGEKQAAGQPAARLNILLSQRLFVVANRNDVAAAMKKWGDVASCAIHIKVDSKVDVAQSQSEIRRRLLDKSVDVLVLDSVEFLKLSAAGLVEGVAVVSRSGQPTSFSYVLLTGDRIDTLAQLRSRSATFFPHTLSAFSVAFMDMLLARNHLGRAESFLGPSNVTNKPTDCILPLFFGRTDACVVDSYNWELAKEMNPQLGKKLKVFAQSAPLVDEVTAIPAIPRMPEVQRQQIVDGLLSMHKYPAGNQILAVFKSGPMILYKPEYLDSTRAFWEEYVRILSPAERAAWGEYGWNVIPKRFERPSGWQEESGGHP